MKNIKTAFIGGDMRQLAAAGEFSKKGALVSIFGFDGCESKAEGVRFASSCEDAEAGCDCLVLPLPYGRDGKISCPMTRGEITLDEVMESSGKALITGGKLDFLAYDAARA